MSDAEFKNLTGLSRATYNNYKKENGNSKEKHRELHIAHYLQPFTENPHITEEEYINKMGCSASTFRKYRRMFKNQQ